MHAEHYSALELVAFILMHQYLASSCTYCSYLLHSCILVTQLLRITNTNKHKFIKENSIRNRNTPNQDYRIRQPTYRRGSKCSGCSGKMQGCGSHSARQPRTVDGTTLKSNTYTTPYTHTHKATLTTGYRIRLWSHGTIDMIGHVFPMRACSLLTMYSGV